MTAPTLDVAPGRPRSVTGAAWYVEHPDGSVSLVILRRAEGGAPNGLTLAFRAETAEAAELAWRDWLTEQTERVERAAERRSRWGPLGDGAMR